MLKRPLSDFRTFTFDVVGTLIDFEGGLTGTLGAIAAERGLELDPEEALRLYRAARDRPDAGRFPDDLVRVYGLIAPPLGLPGGAAPAQRLRDAAAGWAPFPDARGALARLRGHGRLIAMTNAQRWAFDAFATALGDPFHASLTVDDTGTEKPDPAFFRRMLALVAAEGGSPDRILHVAQSQYHDIGTAASLGLATCWIERRQGRPGPGGTIAPARMTVPDHHFPSMAAFAAAVETVRA